MNNGKREIAINTHLWLSIVLFSIFILLASLGIREREAWSSVGFGVAAFLPLLVFLISPMYYVFSEERVVIIYLWKQKEEIQWSSVRSITMSGSWIGRWDGLPHYHVAYPSKAKRAFFLCGDISKTRKTKRLIQAYCKKEID